jgi:hypothetical protein
MGDGGQFVFSDSNFWIDRLTPDVCRVLFDAALRTNNYLDGGGSGSDLVPVKVRGSTLKTPAEFGPPVIVENSNVLCATLQVRLTHWNQDMARMRRERIIDANGQMLEPPPDPGKELRLSTDASGVAAECGSFARKFASGLRWKLMGTMLTWNAQWGVVWRADFAPEPDPAMWFRETCWREPGKKGGIHISDSPLNMFDKSQSVRPLPKQ